MGREIALTENGINVVLEVADDGDVQLLHFSPLNYLAMKEGLLRAYRLVSLQLAGCDHDDHHGHKHTGTEPGKHLKFQKSRDYINEFGRKLEIVTKSESLEVTSHLQFYNGISGARSWNTVLNIGIEVEVLEYISSFCLYGISKEGIRRWDEKSLISIPHNTCFGEGQWQTYTAGELGLCKVVDHVFNTTKKRISVSSLGTLSSSEYLPMGYYENVETGIGLIWQIENNGSWQWEISDMEGELYLQLSGPNENEGHWSHKLMPGDSFETVPAAVCVTRGGFEQAVHELTLYRRMIRRPNNDNEKLPVIFNDYMNCLWGDPTADKEFPLIDAAALAGCEYYCIDCGWYCDGFWWDYVGEWLPSESRFPGGIKVVMDYIKSRGMVPGLWLEIEVLGIKSPMASKVPHSWFFIRHGMPVIENGRYQLDFRNPEVIRHADGVIDRLVCEYGVGYIKMDYNIDAGPGTETDAYSYGDGQLDHNRAYIKWLDSIFQRYPGLVIEDCSSGGLRMDYALLSRHSILSSSDQADYRKFAKIAASALAGVTPEQCAVWSYPLRNADHEEVVFNMVNAMLMRIHQSGNLAEISPDNFELVREGIACYKRIRKDIPYALPFWPLGIPNFDDEWITFGLKTAEKAYLSVYRMQSEKDTFLLPLHKHKGEKLRVECMYPGETNCNFSWNQEYGYLSVQFPQIYSARIFEIYSTDPILTSAHSGKDYSTLER